MRRNGMGRWESQVRVMVALAGIVALAAATREEAIRAATEFMQLHLDHWPGWEGECELRELVFLAPE